MVPGKDDIEREWSAVAARETGSVLLERAASRTRSGRRLLFRRPDAVIGACQPSEVAGAFAAMESKLAQGFHLAGYIAYEAGYALEPALMDLASALAEGEPLVWMGCYAAPAIQEDCWPNPGLASAISPAAPLGGARCEARYSLSPEAYGEKVRAVHKLISAGETYQANLTMEAAWNSAERPAEMYDRLLRAQPVEYAALLHPQAGWHVLSLSPELFFARRGSLIRTRPMKGTAAPGMDAAETRAQAAWLAADEKNRAENVMIVDLLRSDLGRLCETGSVRVTELFAVERYPTVLQMTSTVEGRLRQEVRYSDLFGALFPSGSIVGAPKIHTMRLLQALEGRPRGIYTGAIGYMSPQGEAEFNVAIRTVSLRNGKARMGVGAGITSDSEAASEYAECLTKTMFLTREPAPAFQLIETLLLKEGHFTLQQQHLERLALSAEYLDFTFNAAHVQEVLQTAAETWSGTGLARVRLLLERDGTAACTTEALEQQSDSVLLLLARERTCAGDRFLRHKTTRRATYDGGFAQAQRHGFADSLFCNERGEITEGAVHNVVLRVGAEWVTPPIEAGVLPGVYRRQLLESGSISERVLRRGDLSQVEEIAICNSVRGLRRVLSIVDQAEPEGAATPVWTTKCLDGKGMPPWFCWEPPAA